MGLKGYRLWAMGQLESTCRAPPRAAAVILAAVAVQIPRCSAASCVLERQTLKPIFHLIGYIGYGFERL
jgi:hypothetical protein